jgi:ferredoxin/flavodoxin---NADP+ reductase
MNDLHSAYPTNAKLIFREDINPELSIVRVSPEGGVIVPFEPGQYAELAFPELASGTKLERRAYSIASTPNETGYYEFYIVLVPAGVFTEPLWKLPTGGNLWLGPKIKGKFTLEPIPAGNNIVAIATGTGLAPFISMYRTYRNTKRWRRFVIIHGARYARDLGYRELFEQWEAEDPNFKYLPSVTRESDTGWSGRRGRVHQLFEGGDVETALGESLSASSTHVLLCGNPAMIDTMQEFLQPQGFNPHSKKHPGSLHFERYW